MGRMLLGLTILGGLIFMLFNGGWFLPGLVSLCIAGMVLRGVRTPPAWAFEHANRMPKSVWVTIAVIGLIPPLGLFSCVLWIVRGRAVERAWAAGDPLAYSGFLARRAANAAARADSYRLQQEYNRGRQDGQRGW